MTRLAPVLESFFTDHLMTQRQASPNTVASYRDTYRLLLAHLRARTGKQPASWTSPTWTPPLSAASCRPWKPGAATAPPPATPACRRSAPYSATPACTHPNTPS